MIFSGIQGSGKSAFYHRRFAHSHVRINLDMLRTRHREAILLRACIAARQPFVVDNTNASREQRSRYIAPARAAGFRVIGYFFDVAPRAAIARNAERPPKQQVPVPAILGTHKRLRPPVPEEGFDELYTVRLDDRGFVVEAFRAAARREAI